MEREESRRSAKKESIPYIGNGVYGQDSDDADGGDNVELVLS